LSTVTALLPAWNAAQFIQPTLDSLSAQTHPQLRVIVSVDRCDDGTAEICEAHAARDARFRVVRQAQRLGYVGNCNALLQMADSDHALFAFHDDLLAPAYVARLSSALDAHPAAVLAFSDMELTHLDGRRQRPRLTELEGVADPVRRGLIVLSGRCHWWVPNRGVFRLDRVRRIGGLKTHGAGEFSADWPWIFHMSLLGEFVRVPELLCHKFYKAGSLSRTWAFTREQFFEVRCACMRELWNSELTGEQKLAIALPLTRALLKQRPPGQGAAG
jgi:glycosyltransferase involved in cell wall biosynthesis